MNGILRSSPSFTIARRLGSTVGDGALPRLARSAVALAGFVALGAACGSASGSGGASDGAAEAAEAGGEQVAPRDGQVILVTGSTSGLGREVAGRLAAQGAHVIIHGRDEERGMEVVREIESEGAGSAAFYRADFADLDEIRELGDRIREDYDRLDVLINNAGIYLSPEGRVLSEEGHELRFQVNYLAGFLLTDVLLPLLEESAPAKIINVASLAQNPIDFDNVMLEEGFSEGRAYGQSKLAQILYTVELAERLEGTGITVNSLHPATLMDTRMVEASGARPRSTVDEGADALMNLVEHDVGTGGFFNGQEEARAHDQAYDDATRERLWQLSEELTDVEAP